MTKQDQKKGQPEALATFGAAARNDGKKPSGQGLTAKRATEYKPGDLAEEEKNAADILGGNATGNKPRAKAAIDRHARTDKRAG